MDSAITQATDWQQKGQWNGSWRYYMGVTTTTPSAFGDVTTVIRGRFKHKDRHDRRPGRQLQPASRPMCRSAA